ncbi:hypothetical protein RRG08_056399 [Elysia crispata]|uniref:Uncharacterized protein n=1 Tax=Elysia crispata TaxID=231223 RepID=A0AAE1D7B2_9GAST|nr:hypothetical protein RRG08_056399 [Elysia crispata]
MRGIIKRIETTEQHIGGLRKLQKIFKAKAPPQVVPEAGPKTLSTVVSTPAARVTTATILQQAPVQTLPNVIPKASAATPHAFASSSSSSSSSSRAQAICRLPRSMCERGHFNLRRAGERSTSSVSDMTLLSDRLVLIADRDNQSVKLFNLEGQHLHCLQLSSAPLRLAVIDSCSSNGWKVAATLWDNTIAILEVNPQSIIQLNSVEASCPCLVIATVDKATLAVGHCLQTGISLIGMSGRLLQQVGHELRPYYMTATPDGCLFMSTSDKKVAKIRVKDDVVLFHHSVPQIKCPCDVTALQAGWSVVTDEETQSLHLVSPDGRWDRELWRYPKDSVSGNKPITLSACCGVCVAVNSAGQLYVLDIVYNKFVSLK